MSGNFRVGLGPLRKVGIVGVTAVALGTAAPSNANAQAITATAAGTGVAGAVVAFVTSPVVLGTVAIGAGLATIWSVLRE